MEREPEPMMFEGPHTDRGGRGVSKEFIGRELEEAYAKIFDAKINGGFNDQGKDIVETGVESIPYFQVKSNMREAYIFLKESLRKKEFIPIAVGQPGDKQEIIDSIEKFGGWVEVGMANRDLVLDGIATVKSMC